MALTPFPELAVTRGLYWKSGTNDPRGLPRPVTWYRATSAGPPGPT